MLALRSLYPSQPSQPLSNPTRTKIPILPLPLYPSKSRLFAQQPDKNDNDLSDGSNGEAKKKTGSGLFGFKWGELLDPDPDNLFAIGLTGLLTWASVQVLWQLFFISGAIIVAALKYSFIAALLLFILIALL